MLTRITTSSFGRDVLKLAGGSAIAQFIAICALPIISRLYTPESFEVFAVFTSLLAILGIASSLGFDIAVPITGSKKSAANLFILGVVSVLASVVIQGLFIGFVGYEYIAYILPDLTFETLLLIPIATLGVGAFNCVSQWSVRQKRFSEISITRIYQSAIAAIFQIGIGLFWPSPEGLCIGRTLNFSAGMLGLVRSIFREDREYFSGISVSSLKSTAGEFRDYPIFITLENIFNIAGTYVPILIVSSYVLGPDGAFLLLAIQVSFLPMNIIGRAVGQVFTSDIPTAKEKGTLSSLVFKIIVKLAKFAIGPSIVVAIISPYAAGIVLGADWARVGILITLAMPWCFFAFISSPISTIVYATGRQRHFLAIWSSATVMKIAILLMLGINEFVFLTETFLLLNAMQVIGYLAVYVHYARAYSSRAH